MSKLEQLDKLLVGYGAEPLENKEESQVEHFSSTLTSVKEVFRFSLCSKTYSLFVYQYRSWRRCLMTENMSITLFFQNLPKLLRLLL